MRGLRSVDYEVSLHFFFACSTLVLACAYPRKGFNCARLQRSMQPNRTIDVAATRSEYYSALGGRDGHPNCDQSFQPKTKGTALGRSAAGADCNDVRKFDARRNSRLGTHVGAEASANSKRAFNPG